MFVGGIYTNKYKQIKLNLNNLNGEL